MDVNTNYSIITVYKDYFLTTVLFSSLLLSGSRSQDIRNVIPFSGRGIVLGGSTRPSASIQKPLIHSATHSPEPADATTATTTLSKRSISNPKAFVNVSGSPVRVTKTNGSLLGPKQRTVKDLFRNKSLRSPEKMNPTEPKQASVNALVLDSALNLNSAQTSPVNKSSSGTSGSSGLPLSKYFARTKSTGIGIPGPIKPENGVPGFTSGQFENRKSSASISEIKPENVCVPTSSLKYFGNSKSSGAGTPDSSSTGSNSTHFGSQSHSDPPPTNFSSKVPSSSFPHFRSPKGPGTGILSSSSPSSIDSEYSVPKSSSRRFENQKSSGTGRSASSSTPSSNLMFVGSPEKSGSFIPASASRSPHKPGAGAGTGGKKRWQEDRNSTHIFDFFQRVIHSPASSSISKERQEEGPGAEVNSSGASGGGGTFLGSAPLTVTCPVCQSKVPESKINQHLDSCLM